MVNDVVLSHWFESFAGFDEVGAFGFHVNWVMLLDDDLVATKLSFAHAHQVQELGDFRDGRHGAHCKLSGLYLVSFVGVVHLVDAVRHQLIVLHCGHWFLHVNANASVDFEVGWVVLQALAAYKF